MGTIAAIFEKHPVITEQPELVPLSFQSRVLFDRLIKEYRRLDDEVVALHRKDIGVEHYGGAIERRENEQRGLATAIAFLSGLHLIHTPGEGGVRGMFPTIQYVIDSPEFWAPKGR